MYNPNANRPAAKQTMGEVQVKLGTDAYNKTRGIYGFFALADRIQSAVTGVAVTKEVAQIREGERLQAEAQKESAATQAATPRQ